MKLVEREVEGGVLLGGKGQHPRLSLCLSSHGNTWRYEATAILLDSCETSPLAGEHPHAREVYLQNESSSYPHHSG